MSLVLAPPDQFTAFPYDCPYSIQTDLMRHLYSAIEQQKVAIVESPTGTGKTLSLLTATLTWLDDDKTRAQKGIIDAIQGAGEPEWVSMQTRERLRKELEMEERDYEERLANARKQEQILQKMMQARVTKKTRRNTRTTGSSLDTDVFLPDPEEDQWLSQSKLGTASSTKSSIMRQPYRKIYYASRTHSQLSQVVPELKKLRRAPVKIASEGGHTQEPPPEMPAAGSHLGPRKRHLEEDSNSVLERQTRAVSLGSRKQLCINEDVRARGGDLDEACREVLSAKKGCGCSYMTGASEDGRLPTFRDQILAAPKDIEELVHAGQITKTCPYFATREALSHAEIVTLPYNLLLQKSSREALGIDLLGQIIVIDEAHNLVSTLLALSTVVLAYKTLDSCCSQLEGYLSRFALKLSHTHLLHLQRLLTLLHAFIAFTKEWQHNARKGVRTEVITVETFLLQMGRKTESINVLEIQQYLHSSKIARKIAKYAQVNNSNLTHEQDNSPPLYIIEAFITALAQASEDGRIIISLGAQDDIEIKYQALNPSNLFQDVIEKSQSVILAGGTMTPMSNFILQLFPHLAADRISIFSCGHIIPQSNMQAFVVDKGPQGSVFNFKMSNLQNETMIIDLGYVILNYARVVPGGMIIFLPSYATLSQVAKIWMRTHLMASLKKRKKVFIEPSLAVDVKPVLDDYQNTIKTTSGAILLAVIGAKLSEGLNFSDDLARMVIIVGLPFANLHSVELQEHLKYADQCAKTPPQSGTLFGKAAIELYENMCMNSVNQSIGRAIRHKDDWASLVLIDTRYNQEKIIKKLSAWISKTIVKSQTFGESMKLLSQFIKSQM